MGCRAMGYQLTSEDLVKPDWPDLNHVDVSRQKFHTVGTRYLIKWPWQPCLKFRLNSRNSMMIISAGHLSCCRVIDCSDICVNEQLTSLPNLVPDEYILNMFFITHKYKWKLRFLSHMSSDQNPASLHRVDDFSSTFSQSDRCSVSGLLMSPACRPQTIGDVSLFLEAIKEALHAIKHASARAPFFFFSTPSALKGQSSAQRH